MIGDASSSFTELSSKEVGDIASHVRHFRHDRTGADVAFLLNSDAAKTFSIAFRTYPIDSSGVAHILEHCVLSGSRAYPVEQIFTELLKGSLQSYLNASTFADFTIYALASPHQKDFANLVNVYLDAVFFPLLSNECFRREGWHLAANGSQQGVVLNEMRGAYASPIFKLAEQARRSLFSAGPFSHAHGGEPEGIPDLTHQALKQFHRRFYHPSNVLVAYSGVGDIPAELLRLGRIFDQFKREDPPRLRSGPVISAPRILTLGYAGHGPSYAALNWAFPEPDNRLEELAYEVLCEVLIGRPFAPLRRALIDGGHCADVVEGQFSDDTSPPRLSIQLVGVDHDRVSDLPQAAREAIQRAIDEGFDAQILAGALNAVEFRYRDRGTWKRPHALGLLLDMTKAWRLGRDPLDGVLFAHELAELRRQPPEYFEGMLRTHILHNPHHTLVTLTPDGIASDGPRKASLPPPSNVPRDKSQPPFNVPRLDLQDISSERAELSTEHVQIGEVPVLLHRRATNGLIYIDLALDLRGAQHLSCAALLGRVLLRSGTIRRNAHEMSLMIGAETGGLSVEAVSAPLANGLGTATHLILRARTLTEQASRLFAILGEVLSEALIPEAPDLIEIVASEIIRIRGRIIPKAHDFLDWRLRAPVSASEETDGLSYLSFLHEFRALLLHDPDNARQRLLDMQAVLLCRKRLVVSVTCDGSDISGTLGQLKHLIAPLPDGQAPIDTEFQPHSGTSDAFILPTEMNFVGAVFDLPAEKVRPASLAVAMRWLENNFLRQKIRERGGAYGVQCRWDISGRIVTFLSYRDPHILRTLDVFSSAGQQLACELTEDELTRSIIAAIGLLDRPKSPSDCGFGALTDWLIGWTPEQDDTFCAQLLAVDVNAVRDFAELLTAAEQRCAAIGGEQAVSHALTKRPSLFRVNRLPNE